MTGKELRKKLVEAGFQPATLAEDLNISHQTMFNRLSSCDVKVSFIIELSKITGLSLSYFLADYIDLDVDKLKEELKEKDKVIVQLSLENRRLKDKIEELQ